jgi:hypothetical protein
MPITAGPRPSPTPMEHTGHSYGNPKGKEYGPDGDGTHMGGIRTLAHKGIEVRHHDRSRQSGQLLINVGTPIDRTPDERQHPRFPIPSEMALAPMAPSQSGSAPCLMAITLR